MNINSEDYQNKKAISLFWNNSFYEKLLEILDDFVNYYNYKSCYDL